MFRVFSHDNPMVVANIKNLLEHSGIQCQLKNEFGSAASGEVPPIEVWPEIWVNERDIAKASNIIKEAIHGNPQKTHWMCPRCTEENPPAFEFCWNCSTERDS